MSSDVIAIGVTCIDHVSIVTRTDDGWETCAAPLVQGGGLSATASCAIGRLGGKVELWAAVGDDYHGQIVRRELESYGVDAQNVRLISGIRTPSAFIEVDSLTGDRTIFYAPWRNGPLDEASLGFDLSRVRRARSILVDGLYLETDIAAARVARESGAVVVADLFRVDGPLANLVSLVDALIMPEEAAVALVGSRDYPRALRRMAELGPSMPAITAGSQGCWYLTDGRIYHCPSFPVKVVDTTGCGDSFHGAYCFSMVQGWSVHESIRFSSAVAALKATKLGGRSVLPTLPDVMRFLEDRSSQGRYCEVS